jgi:hypothetical protein
METAARPGEQWPSRWTSLPFLCYYGILAAGYVMLARTALRLSSPEDSPQIFAQTRRFLKPGWLGEHYVKLARAAI